MAPTFLFMLAAAIHPSNILLFVFTAALAFSVRHFFPTCTANQFEIIRCRLDPRRTHRGHGGHGRQRRHGGGRARRPRAMRNPPPPPPQTPRRALFTPIPVPYWSPKR